MNSALRLLIMLSVMMASPGFAAEAPVIHAVLPPEGVSVGQIVIILGSGFLPNTGPNYQTSNNRIYVTHPGYGPGAVKIIPPGYIFFVSIDTIKFTMPPEVEVMGGPSAAAATTEKLTPGTYCFTVGNIHGRSDQVAFAFHQTAVIVRVSPDAGTTGTEISIEGSGFTPTDNWIGFPSNKGMTGAAHKFIPGVPSPDGKHLRFTIPAEIQMRYLDYSGGGRPFPRQTTEKPRPGTFKISVGNRYGESNLMSFIFYVN
ncbi:MAG: hypothetical protein KKD99_09480 [Proteobacteria bacterium]|nr:hypothetical protein [Pseudomonadota bacterium]MBU4354936.1 hypothetical protein [Pseudomonadota bacterium]MBU4448807.1 hypothetical protein [Pseudomonadota bacterium]MCG2773031.1 hypothetical protein [Desulfobacterales bacterium]